MNSEKASFALCGHCGERIPQFPGLSKEGERRVRSLIRGGNTHMAATRELMFFAKCTQAEAEL